MTCFELRTENHDRVFQTPPNDGHVLECGGVPPLLGKTRVSFRPRLPRRSKSGGAPAFAEPRSFKVRLCDGLWRGRPPHSKTQAKLGAANDALRNCQKSASILYFIPRTKNHAPVFKLLGMTQSLFASRLSFACSWESDPP